jgi:hypothetical protein
MEHRILALIITKHMSLLSRHFVYGALLFAMGAPGVSPADEDCSDEGPYSFFGWFSAHEGLSGSFEGDPDGDGVKNYVEFGFGTDPLVGAAGQGMDYVQPEIRINAQGEAEVVVLQPDFPCGLARYGRHWFWIDVLDSTDLQTWRTIATKPGANGDFFTEKGYSVTETKRAAGDWEIVIREDRLAQGRKWFRLAFYIVS